MAEGVVFDEPLDIVWPDGERTTLPAGWSRMVWRGPRTSTVLWTSVQMAEEVHGHGGATSLVWLQDPAPVEAQLLEEVEEGSAGA